MKQELIFIGPPACGKGTQTSKLAKYLGFPHIDTGSLLRAEIAKESEEGKIAKFADVIAYLSSDLEDRFRLGIHKNFDDDYLELFGEMFAKDYVETIIMPSTVAGPYQAIKYFYVGE